MGAGRILGGTSIPLQHGRSGGNGDLCDFMGRTFHVCFNVPVGAVSRALFRAQGLGECRHALGSSRRPAGWAFPGLLPGSVPNQAVWHSIIIRCCGKLN